MNRNTAPKNLLQQGLSDLANQVGQPTNENERISYGVIAEVNDETSQVKVRFLTADKTLGELVSDGFLPLLNPLQQIFSNYGGLREGLLVRIFWRGKIKPTTAIIEVIGDEDSSFLQKEFTENDIEVGPHWILSGGLGA
jgi:hypothetical protein